MGFLDSLNPVTWVQKGLEWGSNVLQSAKAGAVAAYNYPMPGGIAGWIATGGLITVGVMAGGLIAGAWNTNISAGIYSVACYSQLNAMGYNDNNLISNSDMCSIPNCKDALGDQCDVQELKYSTSNQKPNPVYQPPNPVFQPKPQPTLVPPPTITPRPKPIPTLTSSSPVFKPSPTPVQERCDIFNEISMSTIFLEWQPGSPLTFYLKMAGGVPGLERNIVGDDQLWYYDARIGGYDTNECNYQGYKERLYCNVSLPSEYSSSIQPMDVYVNGCNTPIYTDQRADIPGIEGSPSARSSDDSSSDSNSDGSSYDSDDDGGSACYSGLSQSSCSAAGGNWHTTFCTIPPCPAWCDC